MPEVENAEPSLEEKVAAAAIAQAGEAEKTNNQDNGAEKPEGEKKTVERGEDGRFKSLRQRIEKSEKAVSERDQRIAKLEGRLEQTLDLIEKQAGRRAEPDADPLGFLKADDPDRDLLSGKVKPLFDRSLTPLARDVAEIKATLAELKGEGKQSAADRERASEYNSALEAFIEERGLPPEAARLIAQANKKGIGGETYTEAFDNALTYIVGKSGGKALGKAEAKEKTSVGGVMPGMVSSPEPSGDFKTLRRQFSEARASGDGSAEDRLFQDLFKRAQEEQGR